MVVLITSTGVYLILALVFLVVIGGGAVLAYHVSKRQDCRAGPTRGGPVRHAGGRRPPGESAVT
jgi:hypothetical protein